MMYRNRGIKPEGKRMMWCWAIQISGRWRHFESYRGSNRIKINLMELIQWQMLEAARGGERRAGDYESILKGYWSITEASIDARRNCAECSTLCGTAPLPPCHVTGAHRKIKSNVANKQKSFWCDPAGTILQDRSLPPLRIPADDPGKNPEEEKKKVTNKPKSLRRDPAGAILQDRPLWGSRRIIFERIQKYH